MLAQLIAGGRMRVLGDSTGKGPWEAHTCFTLDFIPRVFPFCCFCFVSFPCKKLELWVRLYAESWVSSWWIVAPGSNLGTRGIFWVCGFMHILPTPATTLPGSPWTFSQEASICTHDVLGTMWAVTRTQKMQREGSQDSSQICTGCRVTGSGQGTMLEHWVDTHSHRNAARWQCGPLCVAGRILHRLLCVMTSHEGNVWGSHRSVCKLCWCWAGFILMDWSCTSQTSTCTRTFWEAREHASSDYSADLGQAWDRAFLRSFWGYHAASRERQEGKSVQGFAEWSTCFHHCFCLADLDCSWVFTVAMESVQDFEQHPEEWGKFSYIIYHERGKKPTWKGITALPSLLSLYAPDSLRVDYDCWLVGPLRTTKL